MLFKYIENFCIKTVNYKELMNFVALKEDVGKSNDLVRTMMAIIHQNID